MWQDWDNITAGQAAADEADRIMRERREQKRLEREQWQGPMPPVAATQPEKASEEPEEPIHAVPLEIVPPRPAGTVRGEPRWFPGGRYMQGVIREQRMGGVTAKVHTWEELPTPEVDPARGRYLAAKMLRAQGERGLKRLRAVLRGEDTE